MYPTMILAALRPQNATIPVCIILLAKNSIWLSEFEPGILLGFRLMPGTACLPSYLYARDTVVPCFCAINGAFVFYDFCTSASRVFGDMGLAPTHFNNRVLKLANFS